MLNQELFINEDTGISVILKKEKGGIVLTASDTDADLVIEKRFYKLHDYEKATCYAKLCIKG